MSEGLIEAIINKLKTLKHPEYETLPLLKYNELQLVKASLRELVNDDISKKIGELEGKVFVYEEIIKKSNFAPMVKENEKKLGDSSNEN